MLKRKLSKRVLKIIKMQKPGQDVLKQTLQFVKDILEPKPERYDMTYRYEHTLRVVYIGQKIAEGEKWEKEPLMIACLLHDVGYPECTSMEDLHRHPAISVEIAERYLKQIHYDVELTKHICRAIAIHDKVDDLPKGATAFELSVRDADDIDRSDIMRMCILGHNDIGEHSAKEVSEMCSKRLQLIESSHNRVCGTDTAKNLWEEQLAIHKQFYEGLKKQMDSTKVMEELLK